MVTSHVVGPRSIALIADIVASRHFVGGERQTLQERLSALISVQNRKRRHALLSRFVITAGDEFQALFKDPTVLPDVVWDLEEGLAPVDVRLGLGCGTIETALTRDAVGMDGPVWHLAREALDLSKAKRLHGGVFRGFGNPDDAILGGLARLLRNVRERLSPKQRAVLTLLRREEKQLAVAGLLHVTKQVVSKQAKAAGWDAYREGEDAWRSALRRFDYSSAWKAR
jgi:hypothetical protein